MKGKIESAKSGREVEKRKTLEYAKVRKDKQKRRQQTRKDPFRKTGKRIPSESQKAEDLFTITKQMKRQNAVGGK